MEEKLEVIKKFLEVIFNDGKKSDAIVIGCSVHISVLNINSVQLRSLSNISYMNEIEVTPSPEPSVVIVNVSINN